MAIAAVYKARREYDAAKEHKDSNVIELQSALTTARSAELLAVRRLHEHIEVHGCAF